MRVIREDRFCAKMTRVAGLCLASQASGKAVGREENLASTQNCQIMSNGYTHGQTKCGEEEMCKF